MKIKAPWWMNSQFTALQILMGKRSSEKAKKILGFREDSMKDLEVAVNEAVQFYKDAGILK